MSLSLGTMRRAEPRTWPRCARLLAAFWRHFAVCFFFLRRPRSLLRSCRHSRSLPLDELGSLPGELLGHHDFPPGAGRAGDRVHHAFVGARKYRDVRCLDHPRKVLQGERILGGADADEFFLILLCRGAPCMLRMLLSTDKMRIAAARATRGIAALRTASGAIPHHHASFPRMV